MGSQTTDVRKTQVVLVTIAASVAYGIVHDEITAHLCVEYFSLAHPDLFHTSSPAILGLGWGIAATIGIGAVLGVLLAGASQSGCAPPVPIRDLLRSILILLGVMALGALLAGGLGFELSRRGILSIPDGLVELISPSRRDRFMAVWFAHGASYLAGFVGGAILIVRIWNQRGRPRVVAMVPRSPLAAARALILAAIILFILYLRFARS